MSSSSSSSSTTTAAAAVGDEAAIRAEISQADDELKSIKDMLQRLNSSQPPLPDNNGANNQLQVAILKWQGFDVTAQPQQPQQQQQQQPFVTLQLSSPVEEAKLDALWDPLNPTASIASFEGVVTSMATLAVSLVHHTTVLGTLESPLDVSLLCPLDAMNPQAEYVTELPVTLVPLELPSPTTTTTTTTTTTPATNTTTTTTTEATSPTASEGDDAVVVSLDNGDDDDVNVNEATTNPAETTTTTTATTTTTTTEATTTTDTIVTDDEITSAAPAPETTSTPLPPLQVTLRVTYKPSAKDLQEALYQLLSKAGQRKAEALDRLRHSKFAATTTAASTASSSSSSTSKPPATITPGFLNNDSKNASSSSSTASPLAQTKKNKISWKQRYEYYLGPDSLLRLVMPIAKNYIIFFGAVVLFHYQGQQLALPAPV